jgi:hypothetical protein
MVSMLFAWTGFGLPFWFGGGFNPAGSLPTALLLPDKFFTDGLRHSDGWLIYVFTPFLAGILSAWLHIIHRNVYESVKQDRPDVSEPVPLLQDH